MSIKLTASDSSLAQAFLALKGRDDLAHLLDIKPAELRYYLYKAKNYKTFEIQKRSGGKRLIHGPVTPLKIIQRKLNQVLHAVYKGRSSVHGFARNRSIRTNARRHLNCRVLINFDLADFFPSINFGRVKGLFESKPYSLPSAVAVVLSQICCHDKVLPAGAPTSPVVANMICAQMDSQLKKLTESCKCSYTRYADDITISTVFDHLPKEIALRDENSKKWAVGDEVNRIVRQNGFQLNAAKTRVLYRGSRQEVTRLIINNGLNVKRRLIRQVRAMLHAWEKWDEKAAAAEFHAKYDRKQRAKKKPDFKRVVRGKVDFVGFVRGRDDLIYLHLIKRYLRLDPTAKVRTVTVTADASDSVLAQAVWLLEADEHEPNPRQGTAFALEGYGLITAAHNLAGTKHASQPHVDAGMKHEFTIVRKDDHHDVAQIAIKGRIPVQLGLGPDDLLRRGQQITLLGFPDYYVGAQPQIVRGPITHERIYSGVQHFVIQPDIIQGNSGGPVLDAENRVVGVAIKGQ